MQAVIDRRRDDGDERLVDAAERLIETAQQFGGKTRGKRRARLVDQRADGFEAEPAQRRAGFRRQPQGRDRQIGERRGFPARGQNKQRRSVKARGRPGGARRVGHRKPRREPETAKPCGKIGDQAFLAAEQMGWRLRCRGKNHRRRCPRSKNLRTRAKRSACSASPITPAGAARHRRRRHRRRALAKNPLSPARRPKVRRRQAPPPPPPRSRRRCAGRRRRQRQGRTAAQDRPACKTLWPAAPSLAPRENAGSASAAARLKRCAT